MQSVGAECNELKTKYDACFQVWFSEKFLKGDPSEDMCKPLFIVYRDCVRVRIRITQMILTFTVGKQLILNEMIFKKVLKCTTRQICTMYAVGRMAFIILNVVAHRMDY